MSPKSANELPEFEKVTENDCGWLVYAIADAESNKTYVGATNNLKRRLRQHNRELAGGAKYTATGANWKPIWTVHGFWSNKEALQFEWSCKHIVGGGGKKSKKNIRKAVGAGVDGRVKNLERVINYPQWTQKAPPSKDRDLLIRWYFPWTNRPAQFQHPENVEMIEAQQLYDVENDSDSSFDVGPDVEMSPIPPTRKMLFRTASEFSVKSTKTDGTTDSQKRSRGRPKKKPGQAKAPYVKTDDKRWGAQPKKGKKGKKGSVVEPLPIYTEEAPLGVRTGSIMSPKELVSIVNTPLHLDRSKLTSSTPVAALPARKSVSFFQRQVSNDSIFSESNIANVAEMLRKNSRDFDFPEEPEVISSREVSASSTFTTPGKDKRIGRKLKDEPLKGSMTNLKF